MTITGAHMLLYTPEAEALRAVLRDVLGWEYAEDTPGWLMPRSATRSPTVRSPPRSRSRMRRR